MATFVMFGEYTTKSVREISAARTEKADALIVENGGSIVGGYALLGEHDLMLIAEFPSVEMAMKTSVGLAKMLGIAFTTCPAVTLEEFDKLVG